MTWDQYKTKWNALKSDLREASGLEILALPAQAMLEGIKDRVFGHGATTDGQLMEAYSTKPTSFQRSDFDDKGAFTAGKGKSMFLPQGYRQLRQIQGKEVGYINLDYTGKMKNDLKTQSSGNAVKILFSTKRSAGLRVLHERRFGDVFPASTNEREVYTAGVVANVNKKTLEILSN